MLKAARVLALLAGALAAALAPCAPSLAWADICRMPGCATPLSARVGPADCCCAVSNAPAVASPSATIFGMAGRTAPPAPAHDIDLPASCALLAGDASTDPPVHVPLFLLHSSLLI